MSTGLPNVGIAYDSVTKRLLFGGPSRVIFNDAGAGKEFDKTKVVVAAGPVSHISTYAL